MTTQITQELTCPNPDCSGEPMYAFRMNGEGDDRDDLDLDEYMYDPVGMNHIFKCLKCKTHVLGCPKCSEGYGVIFDDYDEDGDALDLYPVTDKYFEGFITVPMTFLGYDGMNEKHTLVRPNRQLRDDDHHYTQNKWYKTENRKTSHYRQGDVPEAHKKEDYIQCYVGDLGCKYYHKSIFKKVSWLWILDDTLDDICITGPDGGWCHYWSCDKCEKFYGFTDK